MEAGHTQAESYPLGRLYDESNLITERQNARISTEAILIQLAAASVISDKARKALTKQIKELRVTVKPRRGLFD